MREKWGTLQGGCHGMKSLSAKFLKYLLNFYFPGLCEEHSPGSSNDLSSTRVRMQGFWRSRGILHLLFIVYLHTMLAYNSFAFCFRTDQITAGGFPTKKCVCLLPQTKDAIYTWTTKLRLGWKTCFCTRVPCDRIAKGHWDIHWRKERA